MHLFVYHYLFILSLCFGANIKTGFLKSRVSEGALKANLRHLRVGMSGCCLSWQRLSEAYETLNHYRANFLFGPNMAFVGGKNVLCIVTGQGKRAAGASLVSYLLASGS